MFKAVHKASGQPVNILAATDDGALDALRTLDRQDMLLCPVCHQPVRVRAGEVRIEHFAHKHLAECLSQSESPELLNARAVLFRWLQGKFKDSKLKGTVEIEKVPEGISLPRHIDCWVETERSGRVAYWIVEHRMSREDRHALLMALESVGAKLNVVFLAAVMRRNGKPKDILNLNTAERAFMRPSDYDAPHSTRLGQYGGSLHYLDADAAKLTTLRAMYCTEEPQEHTGVEVTSPLAEVRLRPSNGEFVHPGEQDRWAQFREADRLRLEVEKRRRAQEEQRQRELARQQEEERRRREERATRQSELRRRLAENRERQAMRQAVDAVQNAVGGRSYPAPVSPAGPTARPDPSPPPILVLGGEREGTCVYCGARTRDWWYYDGATGQCKCNACKRKTGDGPTGGPPTPPTP